MGMFMGVRVPGRRLSWSRGVSKLGQQQSRGLRLPLVHLRMGYAIALDLKNLDLG